MHQKQRIGFASLGRNKTLKHKGYNDLSNSAHKLNLSLLHSCFRIVHTLLQCSALFIYNLKFMELGAGNKVVYGQSRVFITNSLTFGEKYVNDKHVVSEQKFK